MLAGARARLFTASAVTRARLLTLQYHLLQSYCACAFVYTQLFCVRFCLHAQLLRVHILFNSFFKNFLKLKKKCIHKFSHHVRLLLVRDAKSAVKCHKSC
jgi:hypothetical protein